MKVIPLTQGQVAFVSEDDYPYLSPIKWYAHETRKDQFYARGRCEGKRVYMHALISERAGHPPNKDVDHRNGNTLDNRRCNLRPATHQENMRNMRRTVTSASGVRGVHRNKDRWIARLTVDGKGLCFGTYDTIAEAAAARRKAEREYFGEFAALEEK
jgi:hypothetical protein